VRISFVEPHLKVYGGIRRIVEFANRFVDRGEDVTIYHPEGTPCDWLPCRARILPTSQLHESDHDVAIYNNPPDYPLVRRARARLKVFYILALYDRDQLKKFNPKIFWPKKGRMMALKRSLQMPFLHVSNATWMQRWLRENLNMETELQLGGVNHELFHPVPTVKDPDVFRILCSGDTRAHKGTATIVKAVEIVQRKYPSVKLDTYHGKGIAQEDMAAEYGRADLFVDAQWYAGWNNPVVESMACGVPIVCSAIGGVEDFAVHEETALHAPARDVDAFAEAIDRLIASRELRESLVAAGLERVKAFEWDQAADQFLAMLYRRSGLSQESGASR